MIEGNSGRGRVKWRSLAVAVGAAAAVVPLVGCGDSGDSGSSGASGGSKSPIKIGYLTSVTGPIAGAYADAKIGFESRIAMENAKGGVDGHKLEVIVGDDQSTQPATQAAVRNLVQGKGVKILAPYSAFTSAVAPFLKQQGIPVVGTAATDAGPEWTPDANFFSVVGSADPSNPAVNLSWGEWYKMKGSTNTSFVGVNVQPVQEDRKSVSASWKAAGLKSTYSNSTIPLSQVSGFGGIVRSMVSQGIDGVKTSWVPETGIGFMKDVDAAGARSQLKNILLLGTPGAAELKSAAARKLINGTYTTTALVPTNADRPEVEAFNAAIAKYGKTTTPLNDHGVTGWLMASAVIRGLKEAGPTASKEDFIAKLRAVKDFTGEGMLIEQVDLKASQGTGAVTGIYPRGCLWFLQYDGTEYKPEPEPVCAGLQQK